MNHLYIVSNDTTRDEDATVTPLKQLLTRGVDLQAARTADPVPGTSLEAIEMRRHQYYGAPTLLEHRINDTRSPDMKAEERELVNSLGNKIVAIPTAHWMAIIGMIHIVASEQLEDLGWEREKASARKGKKYEALNELYWGLDDFVKEFCLYGSIHSDHQVVIDVTYDHAQALFLMVKNFQHDPLWRVHLLRQFNARYRESYWLVCSHLNELSGGTIMHASWQPLDEVAVAESIDKLAAFLEREDDFSILA